MVTVEDLHESGSCWYARDIAGNIAFMALADSYMPVKNILLMMVCLNITELN